MDLTEDEIIQKYGNRCGHCNRNSFLPQENEWSCLSSGFKLIKRKHELSKIQRKKINFINRLKNAEQQIFCICLVVYKIYEGNDYDKIYEVLSTLKIEKLKINDILIEKYKNMLENFDFEQDYWSKQQKVFTKSDMILLD